jgi:hypothetical protein
MRHTPTERELIHRRRTEKWYEAGRLAKSGGFEVVLLSAKDPSRYQIQPSRPKTGYLMFGHSPA